MTKLDFLTKEHEGTGFGIDVSKAASSREVLENAGLNWNVGTRKTFYMDNAGNFIEVPGVFQNVREEDGKSLGTVTGRYKICQNRDAFDFTDELLGAGVRYDRAGSFHGGRSVWISARMPEDKIILGDPVAQNLVFLNSHDGTGAVRVIITPKRIVCSNAINLVLHKYSRKWACVHTGVIQYKLDEAKQTLLRAEQYMDELAEECEELQKVKLSDTEVSRFIRELIPIRDDASPVAIRHAEEKRQQLADVFYHKDDLRMFGNSAYRFINAVSDFATHAAPTRETKKFREALYEKTVNGHPLIDRAHQLVLAAA